MISDFGERDVMGGDLGIFKMIPYAVNNLQMAGAALS